MKSLAKFLQTRRAARLFNAAASVIVSGVCLLKAAGSLAQHPPDVMWALACIALSVVTYHASNWLMGVRESRG